MASFVTGSLGPHSVKSSVDFYSITIFQEWCGSNNLCYGHQTV